MSGDGFGCHRSGCYPNKFILPQPVIAQKAETLNKESLFVRHSSEETR